MKHIAIFVNESASFFPFTETVVDSVNDYLAELARATPLSSQLLVSLFTFNAKTRLRPRFTNVDSRTTPRLFRNNDLFAIPSLDKNQIYAPTGAGMVLFLPKELTTHLWFGTITA